MTGIRRLFAAAAACFSVVVFAQVPPAPPRAGDILQQQAPKQELPVSPSTAPVLPQVTPPKPALPPSTKVSVAVKDFRYNAWYGPEKAPRLNPADYRLQLVGRIDNKRPWTVDELYALPQVSQVTRHVCVEGWSMVIPWLGYPLASLLAQVEPLGSLKEFRRLGLGRAVLLEGLHRLQISGAKNIFVETDNYRDAAFRLYQSVGFEVVQDVLVYRKNY